MTIQLREFGLGDLGEVMRLEGASFPSDAYPERIFRHWHRISPSLFLVAALEGGGTGLAARGGSRDAQVASAAGSDARSRDAGNAGTLSRSGNAADGPAPPQDGRSDFHCGLLDGYALGSVDAGAGHATPARGRIISIAVDPEQRGRGVAKALCDDLMARLEGAPIGVIDLEVRVDNLPAIRLWRRLGFREIGVLRGYYGEQGDGLAMRRMVSARREPAGPRTSQPAPPEPGSGSS